MATSTNNIRKTITNLDEPQQIRELNRQLDWVWRQLLGKLDAKSFSTKGLSELFGFTRDVFTEEISNEDAGAAAFLTALGVFAIKQVAAHTFTASQIVTMLADIMTLSKDSLGKVHIDNFAASTNNISDAATTVFNNLVPSISVTQSMLAQDVWTEVQRMIDASIGNGGH